MLQPDPVVVSTDGSTLRNGKRKAVAGYGGYFGPKNKLDFGLPLGDGPQTNNRAELMAIYEALRRTPLQRNLIIRTDSDTSKKCLEGRYKLWKLRSFKQPKGYVIVNEDIIKEINELVRRRIAVGSTTTYVWIRGHVGDVGNEAADKLAKQGAKAQMRHWYKTTSKAERDDIDREERAEQAVRTTEKSLKNRIEEGKKKLAGYRTVAEADIALFAEMNRTT